MSNPSGSNVFGQRLSGLVHRVIVLFLRIVAHLSSFSKQVVVKPRKRGVTLLIILAFLLIFGRRDILWWRSLSGPVIDLLLYIGIGVLTTFVAILGGHVATNNRLYRWLFYISGTLLAVFIITSGIRNYRSAMSAQTAKQIVTEAVHEASNHTDEQIGIVRTDLKDATQHSDQQINSIRNDFKGSMVAVTGLISKTANDLSSEISKVNKLEPPERPVLQFTLWGDGKSASLPLTVYPLKANKDGTFGVDFSFTNTSEALASKVDFWVQVCDGCTYSKETPGFDRPAGLEEHVRHRFLPGIVNPGTSFEKTTVFVKTVRSLPWFDVEFRYTCETCGKVSDNQVMRILVLQSQ
jgi:hypothetical protein